MEGPWCEQAVLLSFLSWLGERQGKRLSPLSDCINRIIYSLLLFHFNRNMARFKYFSHLFISISDSIYSKWRAHKIIALQWVRKLLAAIERRQLDT